MIYIYTWDLLRFLIDLKKNQKTFFFYVENPCAFLVYEEMKTGEGIGRIERRGVLGVIREEGGREMVGSLCYVDG